MANAAVRVEVEEGVEKSGDASSVITASLAGPMPRGVHRHVHRHTLRQRVGVGRGHDGRDHRVERARWLGGRYDVGPRSDVRHIRRGACFRRALQPGGHNRYDGVSRLSREKDSRLRREPGGRRVCRVGCDLRVMAWLLAAGRREARHSNRPARQPEMMARSSPAFIRVRGLAQTPRRGRS